MNNPDVSDILIPRDLSDDVAVTKFYREVLEVVSGNFKELYSIIEDKDMQIKQLQTELATLKSQKG